MKIPSIQDLVTLTFRLLAAQLIVGLILSPLVFIAFLIRDALQYA